MCLNRWGRQSPSQICVRNQSWHCNPMRQEFNKFNQSMPRTETLVKFVFVFSVGGTTQPRQLLICYHNMDRLEGFQEKKKNLKLRQNWIKYLGKLALHLRAVFSCQQNWCATWEKWEHACLEVKSFLPATGSTYQVDLFHSDFINTLDIILERQLLVQCEKRENSTHTVRFPKSWLEGR